MIKNYSIDNISILNIKNNELIPFFKELYFSSKESHSNIQLVTFNLDFLYTTVINNDFREFCINNKYNFADGYGITSLIAIKDRVKIPRITGTDIFVALIHLANQLSLKVALIGSTEMVLQKMKSKLTSDFCYTGDGLFISPPINFENNFQLNTQVLDQLSNYRPDFVFLALGSPRQEFWLQNFKEMIDCKLCVGVGAVFDLYSGEITRAPQIMQRLGFEWFWRLIHEPRRLYKRYLFNNIPTYFKYYFRYLLFGKQRL